MSLFGDRLHRPRRPGGHTYRRIRTTLAAAPVLILLPGLVMLGARGSEPGAAGVGLIGNPSGEALPGSSGATSLSSGVAFLEPSPPTESVAGSSGIGVPGPGASQPSSSGGQVTPTALPTPFRGATATPMPTPRATAAPTPKPPAPPAGTNLALGVWSGQPWNPGSLDAVKSLLGGNPSIFLTYQHWLDRGPQFLAGDASAIRNRGAAWVVTWEPDYSLQQIAQKDASSEKFITDWAKAAAAWGHTIYLRPMHEMNGDWYPWGRGVNGNTPADFVNAWRRMHDIFVAQGATNVKWVWCPNVRYGSNYPLADLYPGSGYVDWLCLDGYNWGLDHHLGQPKWQSFEEIFGATYRELIALAPGKPMMIAETASTENGGNKAQWILQTFLNDVPKYPVVKAVMWFNQSDGPSNFTINSSGASLSAFKQVFNSSAWQGHLP